MKIQLRLILFILIPSLQLIQVLDLKGQTVNPILLNHEWPAKWIAVPGQPANEYGVYLFRKTMDLKTVPATYLVHVSADNRYKLYVNEKLVALGPARGDMYYWNYETVDLAPYLVPGNNIVAAKVWNDGRYRPEAQITWMTGFILQADDPAGYAMNTDQTWKCIRDESYAPLASPEIIGYYVAGTGEMIDMKKQFRDWYKLDFDDSHWQHAGLAYWRGGCPKGLSDAFGWMLVPSNIPQPELTMQRLQSIREVTGISMPKSFPASAVLFTIPRNTKATLLLDNGFLTNAYLTFQFSQGRDASISLKYAESLFIPAHSERYGTQTGGYMGSSEIAGKGNRNEITDKLFLGRKDSLISDGSLHQVFSSLYWRTYRYILLTIETKDDPLTVEDLFGTFTGYPYKLVADFESDNAGLQKILETGWRTARLCAMETYMDCPYYEQLQYIGDSRIQALVGLYNSGDDRLMRNALNLMDHSRIAEGLTLSRHPSYSPQIIPPFSLWYIGMLHDYWMYRPDSSFVKDKLPGAQQILSFFHKYQQDDGSLKGVPYWNFTDWVENKPGWNGGVAPQGKDGTSSVYDLQLLWAYQTAAEMEESLGMKAYARLYLERSTQLMRTIRQKYWNDAKGLFADTPEQDVYSQHANSLAILTNVVTGNEAGKLAGKILRDTSMAPASIYFKYYVHRALIKAGLGNDYLGWLGKWHENMDMGMTTWAEDSEISTARSDCHAWGSSPNIEFYRTVLGIDSDAPGFFRVKIEPHLGALQHAGGSIPHPQGNISVKYALEKGQWTISISLPGTLTGTLVWKGQPYNLSAGENRFVF